MPVLSKSASQGPVMISRGKVTPISQTQWDSYLAGGPAPIAAVLRAPTPPVAAPSGRREAVAEAVSSAPTHGANRRTAALQRVALSGTSEGREAKRLLDQEAAADSRKAKANDTAALPQSIADAEGDARAFAKADMQRQVAGMTGDQPSGAVGLGRAIMLAELRKQGIEPFRR